MEHKFRVVELIIFIGYWIRYPQRKIKMIITKKSMISGKEHTADLPVTQEQINDFNAGVKVQVAFPNLNLDQREFMLTGITPAEWTENLPPEDDEDFEIDQYEIENSYQDHLKTSIEEPDTSIEANKIDGPDINSIEGIDNIISKIKQDTLDEKNIDRLKKYQKFKKESSTLGKLDLDKIFTIKPSQINQDIELTLNKLTVPNSMVFVPLQAKRIKEYYPMLTKMLNKWIATKNKCLVFNFDSYNNSYSILIQDNGYIFAHRLWLTDTFKNDLKLFLKQLGCPEIDVTVDGLCFKFKTI